MEDLKIEDLDLYELLEIECESTIVEVGLFYFAKNHSL